MADPPWKQKMKDHEKLEKKEKEVEVQEKHWFCQIGWEKKNTYSLTACARNRYNRRRGTVAGDSKGEGRTRGGEKENLTI